MRNLAARGVVEVNLIAQELNGYGRDLPKKDDGERVELADLLAALETVQPGPLWIRLLYLYPHGFTDRLIEQIANSRRIVPYIDMPLQHISDTVLRGMRRAGDSHAIRTLLTRLRQAIPGLAIRTTFLVGFPGETEADFEELLGFIEEQQFDRVGVFAYSPEEETAAYDRTDLVDPDVAEERRQRLYERQEDISEQKLQRYLGQEVRVLVEGLSEESDLLLQGRLMTQAPEIDGLVYINDGQSFPGQMERVLIEQTGVHDLVGGIVS